MLDFNTAYERLINLDEDLPKKYYKLYQAFLDVLDEDEVLKYIKIRHNRLILSQDLLIFISRNSIISSLNIDSNKIYEFIEYMKNNDYVSETSDCFPIKKSIVQMNKYHNFLSGNNFYLVDKVDDFMQNIKEELSETNLELAIFILLVYFEENSWSEDNIDSAYLENFFTINNRGYQCIIGKELEDGFRSIKIYKLKIAFSLMTEYQQKGNNKLFTSYEELSILAKKYVKNYFGTTVSVSSIRRAIVFNSMMEETTSAVACKYKKVLSVPVSLSELYHLFLNVPKHLMEIEFKNLSIINKNTYQEKLNRYKWDSKKVHLTIKDFQYQLLELSRDIGELDDYADEMYIETAFDFDVKIAPLFFYKQSRQKINILKTGARNLKLENIQIVKENILQVLKHEKDVSTRMVLEYLYYLLSKTYIGAKKPGGISISTFANYIGVLKNHFFSIFSDYENIDESRIFYILNMSVQGGAAKNSINKLDYLIRDFFSFHNKRYAKYEIAAKHVLKSIIFKKEINTILEEIEMHFKKEALKRENKYTNFYRYIVLQYQAFVILGFYSGLRLNEIRTRMYSDIVEEKLYIYNNSVKDNIYSIDVNLKGLKKDKYAKKINSFKSSNASRRVNFAISEKKHAEIFKKFLDIKKNERYIFRDFDSSKLKQYASVLKLSKLHFLNKIIKKTTKRYATIHSLRHSYATYWFLDRIKSNKNFNEILLNFSIEIGHVTPEVTMLNYIHYELIEEMMYDEKLQ